MSSLRTRRKRRQTNMHLRSRGKFKVGHKSKSGRTGSVRSKQLAARIYESKSRQESMKTYFGRRTNEHCARCGSSPEAGEHILGSCEYVPPDQGLWDMYEAMIWPREGDDL